MTWYYPADYSVSHNPPRIASVEPEVNISTSVKEGAKYIIPATIFGVIFKELSTRFSTFPAEAIMCNAKLAIDFGYISSVALMVLGVYKIARNMDDQRNPPPETVKLLKNDYESALKKGQDLEADNERLLAEVDRLKQENAQLRCILNRFIPDRPALINN
jgi:hypothetical protein